MDEYFYNVDGNTQSWCSSLNSFISDEIFERLKGRKIFLSVQKWERRKGWDVLLEAFLQEFLNDSYPPILFIITHPHVIILFNEIILSNLYFSILRRILQKKLKIGCKKNPKYKYPIKNLKN